MEVGKTPCGHSLVLVLMALPTPVLDLKLESGGKDRRHLDVASSHLQHCQASKFMILCVREFGDQSSEILMAEGMAELMEKNSDQE
jgi:hypothetical protein